MVQIDRDLLTALKRAKTKAMYFVFVAKGTADGALIVSKNPIQTKAIIDARKDLGGGTIFKGCCAGGENGQLVFETAKEPPTFLAKALKALIKREAGLTLKVETR